MKMLGNALLVGLLFAATGFGQSAEMFVSPTGNDAGDGTSEHPFQTLEKARDVARRLRDAGPVTITLAGGVYERDKPLQLTAADSGTAERPILWRAVPGAEVRILGGKIIPSWQPVTDPAILSRLPAESRGHVVQADLKSLGITDYGSVKGGGLELFFDDRPMTLARWPNKGFVKITGLVEPNTMNDRGTMGSKTGKFMYDGDRPKRWSAENDIWVHGYWFWDWADERQPVQSIDVEHHIISVKPPYHHYGYRVGQWFYALNILAEIDTPDEWYLDRTTGIIYFWPPSPIEKGRAIVSVAPALLKLEDVSYVTFQGITFEATRDTAITMHRGAHDKIAGCVLRNIGNWAVLIDDGTDNGVESCDIYQIGAGGIGLNGHGIYANGSGSLGRKTLTPAGHYADNNHIHHFGRLQQTYQAAISLGGVGNRATHNLIHDAPHMAIDFGGNDHLIEYNEIYNVCRQSNDAGAIYAGRDWSMRGSVIRYNYLHNITGYQNRGCVGVYLDDMFSGTTITGNVFYKVTNAVFIGGGRDCLVDNNLFVDCSPSLHIDARGMNWAAFSIEPTMIPRLRAMPYQSDLWRQRYPKLVNILDDDPASPKGNLITRNVSVGGKWADIEPQAQPFVTLTDNLTDGDPLFEGTPPDDFRFRDASPAFKLGFKPIGFEKIGLYKDQYRRTLPTR